MNVEAKMAEVRRRRKQEAKREKRALRRAEKRQAPGEEASTWKNPPGPLRQAEVAAFKLELERLAIEGQTESARLAAQRNAAANGSDGENSGEGRLQS
jgi:hypothetical protein